MAQAWRSHLSKEHERCQLLEKEEEISLVLRSHGRQDQRAWGRVFFASFQMSKDSKIVALLVDNSTDSLCSSCSPLFFIQKALLSWPSFVP